MNIVIYFLVSLGALSLGIQNWFSFREYRATISLVTLCLLTSVGFGAFGLHLLWAPTHLHSVYPLIACFIPPALVSFLLHWLELPEHKSDRYLWTGGSILAGVYISLKITTYPDLIKATPAEYIAVLWFAGACSYGAVLLWKLLKGSQEQHRQQRLQQLFLLILATTIALLLEAVARQMSPLMDVDSLILREKISLLQGPVPPFGAVLSMLTLYVLHLNVKLTRLISLQELFSRLASKSIASLVFTLLVSLTLLFGRGYALHVGFQIFLIAVLFLTIYPDIQSSLDFLSNHFFNRQGSVLQQAILDLDREIATKIEQKDLIYTMLRKIHDAGRTEMVALYLWADDLNLYQLKQQFGTGNPIQHVGQDPLVGAFEYGTVLHSHVVRKQVKRGKEHMQAIQTILGQMESELCIPLWSEDVVIGWMNFKSDPYTGGFSTDEIRRLQRLVDKASTALSTIRSVNLLKEQHRLAALGTMSAGLAHEIRNPLAGIKGAAQYLQDGADSDETPMFLQLIISEADRLNRVIEQFLNYSRPLKPDLQYTSINSTVLDAMDVAKASYRQETIEWDLHLNPQLPYIKIDPNLFQQIWLNLFQNAIHAFDYKGMITIYTQLSKCTAPEMFGQPAIEIRIEDNGCGIAKEVQENLFIPFFTTKEKGTGLGLAMTQRIVEVHQGEIQVISQKGEGTTFVIRLPILE